MAILASFLAVEASAVLHVGLVAQQLGVAAAHQSFGLSVGTRRHFGQLHGTGFEHNGGWQAPACVARAPARS